VSPVWQHADLLRGQCCIQQFDDGDAIRLIARSHGSAFDMPTGTIAQRLDVGMNEFWFHALSLVEVLINSSVRLLPSPSRPDMIYMSVSRGF
jgi:hypothetical protein